MTKKKRKPVQHSPGPWWVEGPPDNKNACFHEGNHYAICHVAGREGEEELTPTIAEVWPTSDPEVEEADARLIAAAPDLLEALDSLVGTAENEGEVRALEAEGMIDAVDMQGYELGKCIKQARALLARVQGK